MKAFYSLLTFSCLLITLIYSQKVMNIYGQLVFESVINNKNTKLKPNLSQLRNIKIVLNDGEYQGSLDINDYTFQIVNVKPGKYNLQIQSIDFEFNEYIIEVFSNGSSKTYFIDPNSLMLFQQQSPFKIQARSRQYFEIPQEWTIASLFKSQYSFFIGITVLMLVISKYMPNIEEMQEKERQERQRDQIQQQQ